MAIYSKLRFKKSLGITAAICFSTGSHSYAIGMNDHSKRWYQIELTIFTTDSDRASDSEVWKRREDLGIQYPIPLLELLDTNLVTHSSIPDTIVGADTERHEQSASTYPTSAQHNFATEAYLKLPTNQQLLTEVKGKIARSRHHRILYEAAWRQPIEERNKSTPLLIRGGDKYDDYFELEGTISLSVSRYLHIHTDLWLSKFAKKLDLSDEADRYQQAFELTQESEKVDLGQQPKATTFSDNTHSMNPAIITNNQGLSDWQQQLSLFSSNAINKLRYEPIQTVQLKQSRRMRSNELHYLDHPLLGLVVRITPYERPEEIEVDERPNTIEENNNLE